MAVGSVIPQADPARRLNRYRGAIDQALHRVLDGDHLLLGPETKAFEEEFACYLGARFVVAVSSGTTALSIALSALGVSAGDEVILPALTAVPTAGAIRRIGAVPVFVDIDAATRTLDPAAVETAVGPRTAAIVPVHLHGMPAAMDEILRIAARRHLYVVEDCAHAHGGFAGARKLGTLGHAAAFSFYPTKNLGAAGDAGAVVVADADVAERARRIRSHGLDAEGIAVSLGETGRIDELQAAILRVLLPHLDQSNTERRELAGRYRMALSGLDVGLPPADDGMVHHQFALLVADRDGVKARMAAEGVLTGIHYPRGLHQHPAFDGTPQSLPVTERICDRLLSLPIQPEVVRDQIDRIVAALQRSLAV